MLVDLKGYGAQYKINEKAEVFKLTHKGWKKLSIDRSSNRARVNMISMDHRQIRVPVVHLMQEAFMGGYVKGRCFIHKNGNSYDCSLENLQRSTNSRAARIGGIGKSRSVVKVDEKGHVLDLYRNAKEAAEKNYICIDAVYQRCHNLVVRPFYEGGYTFQYENTDYKVKSTRKQRHKPIKIKYD